jgi:hypothetical protein
MSARGWDYCAECEAYHDAGKHQPVFHVWDEDAGEENSRAVRATAAEHAAERWAEDDDLRSAEYAICSGRSEPTVFVRDADGTVTKYVVSGESVPSYSAREAV